MATDPYSSVLWNDGEDITFGDLNDDQRFLAAKLYDQVLGKLIGAPTATDPEFQALVGANPSTSWAYALSTGGGNPRQGSANNKVKIGAGTLLQKVSNSDGSNATLLAYTFDGTDELTIANGDATNPRVDMIQMALAYVDADSQLRDFKDAVTGANSSSGTFKKQRVQCTLSIKQGTPGASPAYPSPDAGNVPIACVVVGATYSGAAALKYIDTAGAVAVLHDLRMPIKISPHRVVPSNPSPSVEERCLDVLNSFDNTNGNPVNVHIRTLDHWQYVADASPVYYPLAFLQPGDVITSWSVDLDKNTDNTATFTGTIIYTDHAGAHAGGLTGSTNANHPGNMTLFSSGSALTVVGARCYYLELTPSGSVTPAGDKTYEIQIFYKRTGSYGLTTGINALISVCPRPAGRLIALEMVTANGTHTAATTRVTSRQLGGTNQYLSDISNITETGAVPKRKEFKLGDLEANAIFTAGPTVTGNGTHNPPIWGNGKRCYEESMSINSGSDATPYSLAVRMEYLAGSLPDLWETTWLMAEGI